MLYFYGLIAGIITGATYSLIAVSVSLMYRTTGVLSFAHAAFATVAAYVYADLAGDTGWPAPVAAVVAVLVSTLYALIVERVAMRAVSERGSPTGRLIATLGVVSVTVGIILLVYGFQLTVAAPLLLPQGTIALGDLNVEYQQLAIFLLAAATAAGLASFLRRSRFGTAVRAVAENREAARLMGVSPLSVARFNWAVGGALSGVAGVMIAPFVPLSPATFLAVLVKALAASLFGGLVSLPLTFLGGLVVGAIESLAVLISNVSGARDVATLILVVVLLYVRKSWPAEVAQAPTSQRRTPGRIAALSEPARRKLTAAANRARTPLTVIAGLLVMAMLFVPLTSEFWAFVGARSLFIVLQALSLVLLVGWAGQLSLMHGAYVGIGAFMTGYFVSTTDLPLELAIPGAGLMAVLLGAVAGIPALRLPGLQFAVASIVFSTFAAQALFIQGDIFPRSLSRGTLFGVDLFDTKNIYLFMLPVTAGFYLLVWNIRRSTFGELLLTSRDDPTTVAHFGADPSRVRMAAFLLASFIAGIGGAFYGILLTSLSPGDYSVQLSISLLLYAIVGGVQSLWGPVLAALMFGVLPEVMQQESSGQASAWPDIISGLTVIALITFRPAGLASLLPTSRLNRSENGAAKTVLGMSRFELAAAAVADGHPANDATDADDDHAANHTADADDHPANHTTERLSVGDIQDPAEEPVETKV